MFVFKLCPYCKSSFKATEWYAYRVGHECMLGKALPKVNVREFAGGALEEAV